MTVNDFFGNKIQQGDLLVYPGRQSSSIWMNVGVVTRIENGKAHIRSARRRVSEVELSRKGNILVCPERAVIIPRESLNGEFREVLWPLIAEAEVEFMAT